MASPICRVRLRDPQFDPVFSFWSGFYTLLVTLAELARTERKGRLPVRPIRAPTMTILLVASQTVPVS
jgi:hypothetical protein